MPELNTAPAPGTGIVRNASTGILSTADATLTSGVAIGAASSSSALTVGRTTANPALQVSTSVANSATGLIVTARAAGAGVDLSVRSSGSNEDLRITALGSGLINLVATGGVQINGTPYVRSAWAFVQSGSLAGVASLDLAGLSGYTRYRLTLAFRGTWAGSPLTLVTNAHSSFSGSHQFQASSGGGWIPVNYAAQATATLVHSTALQNASNASLVLHVIHDGTAAGLITFSSASGYTGAAGGNAIAGGGDNTASSGITELLTAFGTTLTAGTYLLEGA